MPHKRHFVSEHKIKHTFTEHPRMNTDKSVKLISYLILAGVCAQMGV